MFKKLWFGRGRAWTNELVKYNYLTTYKKRMRYKKYKKTIYDIIYIYI